MTQTVVLALALLCFASVVSGQSTNICFDEKKFIEEMTPIQNDCEKLPENKGDELKIIFCVFKKMGVLKEGGDSFDFSKTKELYLSKTENDELKKKLTQEFAECESKGPNGDMAYYNCFAMTIHSICHKTD